MIGLVYVASGAKQQAGAEIDLGLVKRAAEQREHVVKEDARYQAGSAFFADLQNDLFANAVEQFCLVVVPGNQIVIDQLLQNRFEVALGQAGIGRTGIRSQPVTPGRLGK